MNNYTTNQGKLRKRIIAVLKKEIEDNIICLLDVPNYFNPGDQLIWEGEEQMIKQLNLNIKYRASFDFFNPQMVSHKDCILLHGGGNFGDIYPKHQRFREYIIKSFPKNKIIILPSTVYFSNKEKLQKSIALFSRHPNVVICTRDKNSFEIIKKNFIKNKCYLIPDSAFAILDIKPSQNKLARNKVLFICRTDKEKNSSFTKDSLNFIENLSVSDWPIYNQNNIRVIFLLISRNFNKLLLKFLRLFGLHWDKRNDANGFIKVGVKEQQINSAINFLLRYDFIITTRLHGHILACLLGIPNIILDNSYRKNKDFFDTWMPDNSFYSNSLEGVRQIITKNFPNLLKI